MPEIKLLMNIQYGSSGDKSRGGWNVPIDSLWF